MLPRSLSFPTMLTITVAVVLAALALVFLGPAAAGPASADPAPAATPIVTEFPVTTNAFTQTLPAISGNTVVWEDNRNGNWDIYGKNLAAGSEFPVTTNSYEQREPAVSGNIVVWKDYRTFNGAIYGKNLTTGQEFEVSSGPIVGPGPDAQVEQLAGGERPTDVDIVPTWGYSSPAIDGNVVVWQYWFCSVSCYGAIYGKNLTTGTRFVITSTSYFATPAPFTQPDISGNIVVWREYRNGNYDIFGKNLTTGAVLAIGTNSLPEHSPAVSGNIVVWRREMPSYPSQDAIVGKNLTTGQEFPISSVVSGAGASPNLVPPVRLESPDISGDVAVWRSDSCFVGCSNAIYGKNLATGSSFVITATWYNPPAPRKFDSPAISGDTVVWQDRRNGYADIYGARLQWPLEVYNVGANPDPFNPNSGTTVSYTLNRAANTALFVLDWDTNGVRAIGPVARPAGPGAFVWDGRNQAGQVVSSGLYIVAVVASTVTETAYGATVATADNGATPIVTNTVATPNPIFPPGGTTISYTVSKGGVQVLMVLDAPGTEVRRINGSYRRGGALSIFWDGRNNAGGYLPNGSYIAVPLSVDPFGRVGWSYVVVRVGPVASTLSGQQAQRVASAWVEAHREELSRLTKATLEARLSKLR